MFTVKIYKDGESLVVPLPTEVAARLQVSEGDTLLLVECEGGYQIRKHEMTKVEEIMGRYHGTLRNLSKS